MIEKFGGLTGQQAYTALHDFPQFHFALEGELGAGTELETAAIIMCESAEEGAEFRLLDDHAPNSHYSSLSTSDTEMGFRIARDFLTYLKSKLIVVVPVAPGPDAVETGKAAGWKIIGRLRPYFDEAYQEKNGRDAMERKLFATCRMMLAIPQRIRVVVVTGNIWTDTVEHPEPKLFSRSVKV